MNVRAPLCGLDKGEHHIDLLGPVHVDPIWQARTPGALDVSQFPIDWQRQQVICPQGQQSVAWSRAKDAKGELVVPILLCEGDLSGVSRARTVYQCPLNGQEDDRALSARAP